MEASDIIGELKTFYKHGVHCRDLDRHLTEADVLRWSNEVGWSRSHLFDEIAKSLALGFNTSELSFEFCDAVVNDRFGPVTDTSGPRPELFWDVYSAFDEGEYYHGNNRNEDPVETYTRSMIARIVEVLGTSSVTQSRGGGGSVTGVSVLQVTSRLSEIGPEHGISVNLHLGSRSGANLLES